MGATAAAPPRSRGRLSVWHDFGAVSTLLSGSGRSPPRSARDLALAGGRDRIRGLNRYHAAGDGAAAFIGGVSYVLWRCFVAIPAVLYYACSSTPISTRPHDWRCADMGCSAARSRQGGRWYFRSIAFPIYADHPVSPLTSTLKGRDGRHRPADRLALPRGYRGERISIVTC